MYFFSSDGGRLIKGFGSLKWTKIRQTFLEFGIQLMKFTLQIGVLKNYVVISTNLNTNQIPWKKNLSKLHFTLYMKNLLLLG